MVPSEGRQSLGREIKRALSAGGLSVAAAARKMEVEPKRLYRWIKGEVSPRLDDIERLAIAIGQPLSVRFGQETQEEAPQPTWAREQEARLRQELERNRELIESLVPVEIRKAAAIVREQLRALPPPYDETPNETPGAGDQGSEGSQAQGHASLPDPTHER